MAVRALWPRARRALLGAHDRRARQEPHPHRCARASAGVGAPAASQRLLGFALELRRNQLRTYERAMREYGDVVRLVVGPLGLRFERTCAFHPDGVQRVLAGSREGYSKETPGYREIAAAIGQGLLTSEGQLWQRQRRLVQPLFTRKQIATYATLMAEEAGRTADRWDRAAGHRGRSTPTAR